MHRKEAAYGPMYVPPEQRDVMARIAQSDEATRRACTLAGYLPHLPPTPAPHGIGAALPDRRLRRTNFSPARDS